MAVSLRALVRWDEWRDTKVPLFLVAMFYAALVRPHFGARLLGEMALLLVILSAYAAFGHMINDYSDREADLRAGKRNAMAAVSARRAKALLALSAMLGFVPALYFQPTVIALLVVSYLLAAAYSMPPWRLKERGWLGLLAPALAQRTLPSLVIFAALGPWDFVSIAVTLAATLVGLRYMLVHHIADRTADARVGFRTIVTVHGAPHAARLIRMVFPFEAAAVLLAALGMGRVAPGMGLVVVLYLALLGWRSWRGAKVGEKPTPVSYGLLANFYTVYWPISLAALLALLEPLYLVALAFAIVSQLRLIQAEWLTARRLIAGRRPSPRPPSR